MKTSLVCLGCLVISLAACSPPSTEAPAGLTATPGRSAAPFPSQAASPAAPLSETERLDIAREIAASHALGSAAAEALVSSMAANRLDPSRCEQFQNETRRQRCLDRMGGDRGEPDGPGARLAAAMDASQDDLAALITEAYTDEELLGIRDFYRTAAGQAMLEKAPQISAQYLTHTIGRMRDALPAADEPAPSASR